MKKLFLHIGTEKTGTTTIQEALFVNRELLSREGFHFLQSLGNKNNRGLVAACMDNQNYDNYFTSLGINTLKEKIKLQEKNIKNFDNEISSLSEKHNNVIISSEHFHSRLVSENEIKKLFKLLSKHFDEIKIICYVREQVSTCLSLYSTIIKSGGSINIQNLLESCNPDNIYYNHYLMLKKWAKFFGKENLIVKPFEKDNFLNKNLVDDFFSSIDQKLTYKIDKEFPSQNESLTGVGQIIGRAINLAIPREENGKKNKKRVNVINQLYKEFKGKGATTSKDIYDLKFQQFNEHNILLNNEFIKPKSNKNCFKYSPPKNENTDMTLCEDDVQKLKRIFKSIDRKTIHLDDEYAEIFRDSAIKLQNNDMELSIKLMELAKLIRPNGPFINNFLKKHKKQ